MSAESIKKQLDEMNNDVVQMIGMSHTTYKLLCDIIYQIVKDIPNLMTPYITLHPKEIVFIFDKPESRLKLCVDEYLNISHQISTVPMEIKNYIDICDLNTQKQIKEIIQKYGSKSVKTERTIDLADRIAKMRKLYQQFKISEIEDFYENPEAINTDLQAYDLTAKHINELLSTFPLPDRMYILYETINLEWKERISLTIKIAHTMAATNVILYSGETASCTTILYIGDHSKDRFLKTILKEYTS